VDIDDLDELINQTSVARESYFSTLGEFSGSWSSTGNPRPAGEPHWPTRPGWQRISVGESDMIVSSGLSDPWYESEAPNTGLGIETAIATTDPLPSDSFQAMGTWLFKLAAAIATSAVADQQYAARLERFGLFLIGLNHTCADTCDLICGDGCLGILLGISIPSTEMTFELPAGTASLLTAKLLTSDEYEFAAAHGPDGAKRLAELFAEQGSHHLSSPQRESVV